MPFMDIPAPSRRQLLKSVASGFGYLAFAGLSSLAAQESKSRDSVLAPKKPHFEPRAKNVIFLFMSGGPSHVDTFDYKPQLTAATGKRSSKPGRNFGAKLMGSPWKFQQYGESGRWVSELFPKVGDQVDELKSGNIVSNCPSCSLVCGLSGCLKLRVWRTDMAKSNGPAFNDTASEPITLQAEGSSVAVENVDVGEWSDGQIVASLAGLGRMSNGAGGAVS